jgi:uncharacterized protein YebE (UPF0316 family)
MFISRGDKLIAPILGFFEVLVWLLAIRQIMQNLSNVFCYLAYAGGFATGNLIGILLEEKLAFGKQVIRIITRRSASELVDSLTKKGFGVTNIPAEGVRGKVNVIYTIIERSDLDKAVRVIEKFNPKAFYSIEDIRLVKEGIFPRKRGLVKRMLLRPPKTYRQMRIYLKYKFSRKGK